MWGLESDNCNLRSVWNKFCFSDDVNLTSNFWPVLISHTVFPPPFYVELVLFIIGIWCSRATDKNLKKNQRPKEKRKTSAVCWRFSVLKVKVTHVFKNIFPLHHSYNRLVLYSFERSPRPSIIPYLRPLLPKFLVQRSSMIYTISILFSHKTFRNREILNCLVFFSTKENRVRISPLHQEGGTWVS